MAPDQVSATQAGIAVGRDVIHSILNTGDHNSFFIGDYINIRDAYIEPWEIYHRVKLELFSGRQWLVQEIDDFINQNDRGYLRIDAQAGLGKTTFIAWLARQRGYIHHFCELAAGPEGIGTTLLNLVAQLALAYQLSPNGVLPIAASKPHFLAHWLDLASKKRKTGEKIIILIDGLELAGVPDRQNALGLPRVLPQGVYFIVTTRPTDLYLFVEKPFQTIKLVAESDSNLSDIQQLLDKITGQFPDAPDLAKRQQMIHLIQERSQGVWIYLHYILEGFMQGQLSIPEIEKLPSGIVRYYIDYWQRWRTQDEDQWFDQYLPLLTSLAVAPEPPSIADLQVWTDTQQTAPALGLLLGSQWQPFITILRDNHLPRYQFYHATLKDFFKGEIISDDLSVNELAFLNANQTAAQDSLKRIQHALIHIMEQSDQVASRRRAASNLLKVGWLDTLEVSDVSHLITFLNLTSPNTVNNAQRRQLEKGIGKFLDHVSLKTRPREEIILRIIRGGILAEIGQRENDLDIMGKGDHEYKQAISLVRNLTGSIGLNEMIDPVWESRLYHGAALIQIDMVILKRDSPADLESAVRKASRLFDRAIASATGTMEALNILIKILSEYAFSMSLVKRWYKAEKLLDEAIHNLTLLKGSDLESYALVSASVFERATNIYWDECEWLEENKPEKRHLAFARISKAYQMSQEAVHRLADQYLYSDQMMFAQFNAGECLEKLAEFEQTTITDPLELACERWKTALRIAQALGDWIISEECQERLRQHCNPVGESRSEEKWEGAIE